MCLASDIPARMVVVKLEPKVPAEGWRTGGHPQNVGEFYGGCDINGDFMVILWWFYGDFMGICEI